MITRRRTGTSVPRVDGPQKVTGSATYTADVRLDGAIWGRLLRSPHPYARIVSVDATAARAMAGVHAAVTGADVAGLMTGRRIFDQPLLAREVVRFVGEPVAAVAADDEETAKRAIEKIAVVYEELQPVFDPVETLAADAPILHPRFNEYVGVRPQGAPSNEFVTSEWGTGDPDRGLAGADLVLDRTYTTPSVHQAYMESHTCLVEVTQDGRVDVWASNKAPHYIKLQVPQTTGIAEGSVHIHHTVIGGDFGGKGAQMNIPIAYFLAKEAGRPVRMVMDATEELTAGNPRHPATVRVRTGVKRDGTIVACDIESYYNTGAYAGYVPLGFLPGPRHAVGPYRIPDCRVVVHQVYTNKVPCGHMRGPGEPQTIFAMESHIDEIARALEMDPLEVRLKNLITEGDTNGLGEKYIELHGVETVEAAVAASGYKWAKPVGDDRVRYGRGMALGERSLAGGETHASVTFLDDGTVVVHTSIFEQGSGTYTTIRQMVADLLEADIYSVSVAVWDPDDTGFDSGAGASRNTRMASAAVHDAAIAARDRLLGLCAAQTGWAEGELSLAGGLVAHAGSGGSKNSADVVREAGEPVVGHADYKESSHAPNTAFTVQVAEVAVDKETGDVRLTKLTSVHDAGMVLNPQGHDGQINGGVMQGIGYALLEELVVEEGRVTTPTYADFKIPNIADIPDMTRVTLESASGVGPFTIKGIGENPIGPVAPAVANAVADAVGVRVRDLPVTAEKVYRALRFPA